MVIIQNCYNSMVIITNNQNCYNSMVIITNNQNCYNSMANNLIIKIVIILW